MTNIAFNSMSSKVPVTQFLGYRDYLAAVYAACKAESGFSYVQFAVALGFSASNVVWLVVSGRRKLTTLTSRRVADGLGLTGTDRRYFLSLVRYNNARVPALREKHFKDLLRLRKEELPASQESLDYFSTWYHAVLREMVALPDFEPSHDWISQRLIIPILPHEVDQGLLFLEKTCLIARDKNTGKFQQTGGKITPHQDVGRIATISYHRTMLGVAADNLTRVPAARRDFNVVTAGLTEVQAKQIAKKLQEICELALQMERENKIPGDQIFQIGTQVLPLTIAATRSIEK